MDAWTLDLRFALRSLARQPGFSLVAVLTLAVGIGAGTAIFSVVHGMLLEPPPYAAPEELYRLADVFRGGSDNPMSPTNFADLRRESRRWRDMVAVDTGSVNLEGASGDGERAERVDAAQVTDGFLTLLGVAPAAGRDFTAADDRPGAAPTAILSHRRARLLVGEVAAGEGVAAALGREVRLNGVAHRVVGVAPEGFDLPRGTELWSTFRWDPEQLGSRGSRHLLVFGRLAPGASHADGEAEIRAVFARLAEDFPDNNAEYTVRATPMERWRVPDDARRSLRLLAGAVLLVLLIACVNVVNLLLARGEARNREFAVRAALGAGRTAVVRQFVLEAVMLALAGGVLGVGLATLGTRLLARSAVRALPGSEAVSVNPTSLLFALTLAVACGLGVALVPAWRHARGDAWAGLRSSRGVAGEGSWTRRALVVTEMALAVILLLGAGLLVDSFWRLQQVDLGIDSRHTLGARLELPEALYPDDDSVEAFFARLDEELAALPGVEAVAHASRLPFASGNVNVTTLRPDGAAEGGPEANFVELRTVSPGYFEAAGLSLLRGRGFSRADGPETPPVTVINQRLVDQIFPGGDPVGRRLDLGWGDFQPEVVGVVDDFRDFGAHQDAPPTFYLPETARPGARDRALLLRTAGDPRPLVPALRRAVAGLDPGLPLYDVDRLSDLAGERLAARRLLLGFLLAFAGLALLLGAVGVFSVMSYLVERRTREIGVRMALGSTLPGVVALVMRQGATWALAGVALGLTAGVALGRFLEHALFEVEPGDPRVLAAVAALLLAVALAACWAPARRAARVSPMEALRQD